MSSAERQPMPISVRRANGAGFRRSVAYSGWNEAVSALRFRVAYTTIDEVLVQLDRIIEVSRRRGTTDGYFAALYRRVTAEVKARIERGLFENNERMARFDVIFASRYIDAWNQKEHGLRCTASWGAALGCSSAYWPVLLQHLLLGMNAHINLDLGIVAAEVAPGAKINGLKGDFDTINQLLADLVNDVQDRLARVWPAMTLLDRIGGGADEAVVNFSIGRARAHAWGMAQSLAAIESPAERERRIAEVDVIMAQLARRVLYPGVQASLILAVVRLRERGSINDKLDILLK